MSDLTHGIAESVLEQFRLFQRSTVNSLNRAAKDGVQAVNTKPTAIVRPGHTDTVAQLQTAHNTINAQTLRGAGTNSDTIADAAALNFQPLKSVTSPPVLISSSYTAAASSAQGSGYDWHCRARGEADKSYLNLATSDAQVDPQEDFCNRLPTVPYCPSSFSQNSRSPTTRSPPLPYPSRNVQCVPYQVNNHSFPVRSAQAPLAPYQLDRYGPSYAIVSQHTTPFPKQENEHISQYSKHIPENSNRHSNWKVPLLFPNSFRDVQQQHQLKCLHREAHIKNRFINLEAHWMIWNASSHLTTPLIPVRVYDTCFLGFRRGRSILVPLDCVIDVFYMHINQILEVTRNDMQILELAEWHTLCKVSPCVRSRYALPLVLLEKLFEGSGWVMIMGTPVPYIVQKTRLVPMKSVISLLGASTPNNMKVQFISGQDVERLNSFIYGLDGVPNYLVNKGCPLLSVTDLSCMLQSAYGPIGQITELNIYHYLLAYNSVHSQPHSAPVQEANLSGDKELRHNSSQPVDALTKCKPIVIEPIPEHDTQSDWIPLPVQSHVPSNPQSSNMYPNTKAQDIQQDGPNRSLEEISHSEILFLMNKMTTNKTSQAAPSESEQMALRQNDILQGTIDSTVPKPDTKAETCLASEGNQEPISAVLNTQTDKAVHKAVTSPVLNPVTNPASQDAVPAIEQSQTVSKSEDVSQSQINPTDERKKGLIMKLKKKITGRSHQWDIDTGNTVNNVTPERGGETNSCLVDDSNESQNHQETVEPEPMISQRIIGTLIIKTEPIDLPSSDVGHAELPDNSCDKPFENYEGGGGLDTTVDYEDETHASVKLDINNNSCSRASSKKRSGPDVYLSDFYVSALSYAMRQKQGRKQAKKSKRRLAKSNKLQPNISDEFLSVKFQIEHPEVDLSRRLAVRLTDCATARQHVQDTSSRNENRPPKKNRSRKRKSMQL